MEFNMKNNICNFPCIITVDGVFYQCDLDHKSIDILETILGIGFYEIYEKFVLKNEFSLFVYPSIRPSIRPFNLF